MRVVWHRGSPAYGISHRLYSSFSVLIPFRLAADSMRSPRERFHTRLRRDCITLWQFSFLSTRVLKGPILRIAQRVRLPRLKIGELAPQAQGVGELAQRAISGVCLVFYPLRDFARSPVFLYTARGNGDLILFTPKEAKPRTERI